ncbi:hypothetical protein Q669_08190 [Labrenzia sp. C1B10]|nr:hypothetical protein Q669_08190 [Labrenzia sp. C1B10]ERP99631.1 hypothetical protein Q675_13730 [Labrenzia sp. C1B70]
MRQTEGRKHAFQPVFAMDVKKHALIGGNRPVKNNNKM